MEVNDHFPMCPHCGEELDTDDIRSESGSLTCPECNTEFEFDSDVTIVYRTWLPS